MAAPFLLAGSLDEIGLPDVARLLNATQKTGRVAVNGPSAATGAIYFERGDIVDAQAANLAGLDAVKHLALFNKGGFEFLDGAVAANRNLASYPTMEIIRLLENRMHEARQVQELMPADNDIPKYTGGAIPAGLEVSAAELAVALKASTGTVSTQQLAEELNLDVLMVRYTVARFRAAGLMEMAEHEAGNHTGQVQHEQTPVAGTSQSPESVSSQPKYWRGRKIG